MTGRTFFTIAMTLAAASAAPAAASAQESADRVLERAVATYAGMRTVRASFEQTIANPLTGSDMVAHGEFQRQAPNLVSIRFSDPAGDRIVSDGRVLWLFLPSTNPGQAFKMPLSADGIGVLDPTALMREPKSRFDIEDGGSARIGEFATRVLTLTPKTTTEPVSRATLWIDGQGFVRQFEVVETSGITRRIRMLSIRPNAAVDRSLFSFTPPAGVRVVDQTRGGVL